MSSVLPVSISVRDWPAYSMKKPCGIVSRAISCSAARPAPEVTLGTGSAESVAEFSWLNCSMAGAEPCVETETTAESGTILPDCERTKNVPRLSGLLRNCCGTCVMMS